MHPVAAYTHRNASWIGIAGCSPHQKAKEHCSDELPVNAAFNEVAVVVGDVQRPEADLRAVDYLLWAEAKRAF